MSTSFYVLCFWPLVASCFAALVTAFTMAGRTQRAAKRAEGAERVAARLGVELAITNDHLTTLLHERSRT